MTMNNSTTYDIQLTLDEVNLICTLIELHYQGVMKDQHFWIANNSEHVAKAMEPKLTELEFLKRKVRKSLTDERMLTDGTTEDK